MSPDRVQLFTTAYKVRLKRGRWYIGHHRKMYQYVTVIE